MAHMMGGSSARQAKPQLREQLPAWRVEGASRQPLCHCCGSTKSAALTAGLLAHDYADLRMRALQQSVCSSQLSSSLDLSRLS